MSEQPFDPEAEGVYGTQDAHQAEWERFRDDCLVPMYAAIEGGEARHDFEDYSIRAKIDLFALLIRDIRHDIDTLVAVNEDHKALFRPQPEEMVVVDPTVSDVGPEEDSA